MANGPDCWGASLTQTILDWGLPHPLQPAVRLKPWLLPLVTMGSISTPTRDQPLLDKRSQEMPPPGQELETGPSVCSHILKLPDELLVEISTALQGSPLRWKFVHWHRVNLVCKRWRCVAVAAPELWTTLDSRYHSLTLLMLERSKSVGLPKKVK